MVDCWILIRKDKEGVGIAYTSAEEEFSQRDSRQQRDH